MPVDNKVAQPSDLLLEGVVNGDGSLYLWIRLYQIYQIAETITFALTISLEAFRGDIVVALLVGGVIAAWVYKKLPHRTMGILIGVLLILLNVRTLVLTFVKQAPLGGFPEAPWW